MRPYWLLLFSLASCSPYSFSKEVTTISTGVDQVSAGYTQGYTALAADRAASTQFDLISTRSKAAFSPSCRLAVGELPESRLPCALYPAGSSAPAPSDVERKRGQIMSTLSVLREYAHALAAVTNAADRAAYDAAVAQLSGAAGALAENADAAAPGVSVVAPAAVNLLGWLVGTGLDQQRFDSLKAAVNGVDNPTPSGVKPMHTVVAVLALGLENLRKVRLTVLVGQARKMVVALGPSLSDSAYRQQFVDAQALITVIDGLRHSDPGGTVHGMESAHGALVAAVNDPARSYSDLVRALGDFADKAAALQTAFAATAAPAAAVAKKGS